MYLTNLINMINKFNEKLKTQLTMIERDSRMACVVDFPEAKQSRALYSPNAPAIHVSETETMFFRTWHFLEVDVILFDKGGGE